MGRFNQQSPIHQLGSVFLRIAPLSDCPATSQSRPSAAQQPLSGTGDQLAVHGMLTPGQNEVPWSSDKGAPLGQGPDIPNGRRNALLVGCNYCKGGWDDQGQLQGCCQDVKLIRHMLMTRFGYSEEDITELTDEIVNTPSYPTKATVVHHIEKLMKDHQAGDHLWFSFSGHGKQIKDITGEEEDGKSEAIVLHSDRHDIGCQEELLTDIELNRLLVRPLKEGARLHILLDCCSSGSGVNLAWNTHADHLWKPEYKKPTTYKGTEKGGSVVMIAACSDEGTAGDTNMHNDCGTVTGAATTAFIKVVEASSMEADLSYGAFLNQMQDELPQCSTAQLGAQRLQLSCNHTFDLQTVGILREMGQAVKHESWYPNHR